MSDERPQPEPPSEDPAGTRPRHQPEDLLPAQRWQAAGPRDEVFEGDAIEVGADDEPLEIGAAETTDEHALLPERITPAGSPELAAAAVPTPHAPRFQFLTGVLATLGIAAFLLVVALLSGAIDTSKNRASGPSWSQWKPGGGSTGEQAAQIATHVGPRYHLPDGRQMALAEGTNFQIEDIPLTVALRQSALDGGAIKIYDGKGVLFRLCGLGKSCTVRGTASTDRALMLRREALELALYSMHYIGGLEQVVVVLPPLPARKLERLLFFRRSSLAPVLRHPLDTTLTDTTPSVTSIRHAPDTLIVDQLTTPAQFKFTITQANADNRAFLVLDQLTQADLQPVTAPKNAPGTTDGALAPSG